MTVEQNPMWDSFGRSWKSAPKTGETIIVECERYGVILGRWFEGDPETGAGWDFWEPGENWATAREAYAAGAKPQRWMPWPGKWTQPPEVDEEELPERHDHYPDVLIKDMPIKAAEL